jgi:hypothetical protein
MGEEDFHFIRNHLPALENLNIWGVDNESLPEEAFDGTEAFSSLRRLALPKNLKVVGERTFSNFRIPLFYPDVWEQLPEYFPKHSLPCNPESPQVPYVQLPQNVTVQEQENAEFTVSLINVTVEEKDIMWFRSGYSSPLTQGKNLVLKNVPLSMNRSEYYVKITAPVGSEWISPPIKLTVNWNQGCGVFDVARFECGTLRDAICQFLNEDNLRHITTLKISQGLLAAEDFRFLRENLPALKNLDIEEVENESLPEGFFDGTKAFSTLRKLILPKKMESINERAFASFQCSRLVFTSARPPTIYKGSFYGTIPCVFYPDSWVTVPTNMPSPHFSYRQDEDLPILEVPSQLKAEVSQDVVFNLTLENVDCEEEQIEWHKQKKTFRDFFRHSLRGKGRSFTLHHVSRNDAGQYYVRVSIKGQTWTSPLIDFTVF